MNRQELRRLRERAALTQAELAERVGVAATTIWRLEEGRREGTIPILRRIADTLAEATGKDVADVLKQLTDPA